MSLYGSMRTAVSGMNAQSTRLATVADNIANSGTNGYKRASVEFSSLVIPNTGTSYVSGGVSTQVRNAISQAGPLQYTTSIFDLAVNGGGFFIVGDNNGSPNLTRAGAFVPDGDGYLVNAAGFKLMGYDYANGIPSPVANGYAGLEAVCIGGNDLQATATTAAKFAANLPYTAPVIAPGNLPSTNSPSAEFTNKSSLVVYDNVGQEVLLDVYFTRTGVASPETTGPGPGPLANPGIRTITDGDDGDFTYPNFAVHDWEAGDTASFILGDYSAMTFITVTGTFDGTDWSFAPENPSDIPAGMTISCDIVGDDLAVEVANATGADIEIYAHNVFSTVTVPATPDRWELTVYNQPNATATTSFPYGQPPLATHTLSFDNSGRLIEPTSFDFDLTSLNGALIELDISSMTQLAAEFTLLDSESNGSGAATVSSYAISPEGILYAQYESGQMKALYRLPLATVQSPDRMSILPGNVFQPGMDSGNVQIGFANESGFGSIVSGAVENSNVDIAEELTAMIESQRNYTANSKVFQTGSDLMDVLVNLKR